MLPKARAHLQVVADGGINARTWLNELARYIDGANGAGGP
jgi:hypothetical protein